MDAKELKDKPWPERLKAHAVALQLMSATGNEELFYRALKTLLLEIRALPSDAAQAPYAYEIGASDQPQELVYPSYLENHATEEERALPRLALYAAPVAPAAAAREPDDPEIIAAANKGYADGLADGGVLGALAAVQPDEHAALPSHDDGRETVEDVLAIVRSYGPYGRDINEALRFQIVLADEILCLRALYLSAVKGRQDFRNALREARAAAPQAGAAHDARVHR